MSVRRFVHAREHRASASIEITEPTILIPGVFIMNASFPEAKVSALIGLVAMITICGCSTASAQAREVKAREVKSWPVQGAWRTTLVERPNGSYMCMLNALGREPHAFGVSIMDMPGHLMFAVDDRNSKEGYLPTMTVRIDGQKDEAFTTFNDPPMTATAPVDTPRVRALIDRLAQGKSLTVDARRAQYTLSLEGFSGAAAQLTACGAEMASQQQTVGERP
jgi:hypothetical protein